MQMILQCFGASNTTMTCWCRQDPLEMYNQNFCSKRIHQPSPSRKDGLFRGEYISTAITVSCRLQMHIQGYQTTALNSKGLYVFRWSFFGPLWLGCWFMFNRTLGSSRISDLFLLSTHTSGKLSETRRGGFALLQKQFGLQSKKIASTVM